jgi:peroxiredoxin
MIPIDSPNNTDENKQFAWRAYQVNSIGKSGASNAIDLFIEASRKLALDYPGRVNVEENLLAAMENYEYVGRPDKARALAKELIDSSAAEQYKTWVKGFLNRLDSAGRPVSLEFTSLDGREVDLAKLKGKVVLVDFWATDCSFCVKELPRVKAAYDQFHGMGLEVIGISCDTDREKLSRYIQEKGLPWPQYFDGKSQTENKIAQAFGVDGIPHMFLVDKKGYLRFDDVRASDRYHRRDDTTSMEDKITKLLAEPVD